MIFEHLGWTVLPCAALLALACQEGRPGVLMQGFYWDVPSPAAGNARAPWWWDKLASEMDDFAASGITGVWIPPVLKGASGGYSVGYDPFDDYDTGSKPQKGTIPLRYGTREQLQRMAAVMRANGLDIILDLVLNHRNGDEGDFRFRYLNAYGVEGKGRFAKDPDDFHPSVPQDPNVPHEAAAFGRDVAHVNGKGGRIGRGLIESTGWVTRALDVQGYRIDFAKGISTDWLLEFLNSGEMAGRFAVAEFWDGDDKAVADYVQSGMQGRCHAFDFPLRDLLRDACKQGGTFNMRDLHRAGFTGRDAAHSVTFVDNHDTAREDPVPNKALAYACILTSEGTPCVFYSDWRDMNSVIRNLIWINRMIAAGPTRERWKDDDVFCYERTGGKHLLVGLNDNPNEAKTITPATGFGPNARLHDYTGHGPDVTTEADGGVQITIPANKNGMGYVCYSVEGITGTPPRRSFETTQVYEGAADLDIKPADNREKVDICTIYPKPGHGVTAQFTWDAGGWTQDTRIELEVTGPGGKIVISKTFRASAPRGEKLAFTPEGPGPYTFHVQSFDTPEGEPCPPYSLRVTYLGPAG